MKIHQEQYDELAFLQTVDTKAFNDKLNELLDIETKPCTVYQYFYGDIYVGDSENDTVNDLLRKMGVEIER